MYWVLAQNCKCCESEAMIKGKTTDVHMAILTDCNGYIILFHSQKDASDYITAHTGEDPDDILIIPEMEALD